MKPPKMVPKLGFQWKLSDSCSARQCWRRNALIGHQASIVQVVRELDPPDEEHEQDACRGQTCGGLNQSRYFRCGCTTNTTTVALGYFSRLIGSWCCPAHSLTRLSNIRPITVSIQLTANTSVRYSSKCLGSKLCISQKACQLWIRLRVSGELLRS